MHVLVSWTTVGLLGFCCLKRNFSSLIITPPCLLTWCVRKTSSMLISTAFVRDLFALLLRLTGRQHTTGNNNNRYLHVCHVLYATAVATVLSAATTAGLTVAGAIIFCIRCGDDDAAHAVAQKIYHGASEQYAYSYRGLPGTAASSSTGQQQITMSIVNWFCDTVWSTSLVECDTLGTGDWIWWMKLADWQGVICRVQPKHALNDSDRLLHFV